MQPVPLHHGDVVVADGFGDHVIPLKVWSSETVGTVKMMIQDVDDIPPLRQILQFGGEPLEDDRTLADYNVRDDAELDLILNDAFSSAAADAEYLDASSSSPASASIAGGAADGGDLGASTPQAADAAARWGFTS
jgi:hypothetical protein